MNKIDMNKKYRTRCGYPVRILCVDVNNANPVVAAITFPDGLDVIHTFSCAGAGINIYMDLIEVSPWEDFKKDDKVMVSEDGEEWLRRYFAYEKDDVAYIYRNGATSWTSGGADEEWITTWNYCRKPTKEELGE